ncbi:MAG: hypothetical protein DRH04_09945 [Deltaproteobacteria bacterium]|nr:MAG: hypothetical protein DRH04_09945 [Deltaproteobacteria bacterium]
MYFCIVTRDRGICKKICHTEEVQENTGYVGRVDEEFLPRLLTANPLVEGLWYRGDYAGQNWDKLVAVVGPRKMSRYGKQVISEVVPQLCAAGYGIVSGLMYGVDQEAHKVTLECGGRAVGVLGYGITHKSEEGARKLANDIVENRGVVLSEYEGKTAPKVWTFPQRNRIVVGLSEMVVIIEAGEKSGSLNTASWAVRMKKRILAVPGSVFSLTSVGTNTLIADGTAEALTRNKLRELTGKSFGSEGKVMHDKVRMSKGERELWASLKISGPSSRNELIRTVKKPMGEVMSTLSQLEMRGLVEEERGVWMIS